MELIQVMKERRSVRAYRESSICRETMDELLLAAQLAPSWKNSQTGRYYVVLSEEMRQSVRETCLPSFNRERSKNASALIVTAYETGCSGFTAESTAVNELGDGWGAYDLGLQNQNLLLRAKELGWDTLVMGIRDGEQLRALLSIPNSQAIVSVIAVGMRAEDEHPTMPPRKALDEIARYC